MKRSTFFNLIMLGLALTLVTGCRKKVTPTTTIPGQTRNVGGAGAGTGTGERFNPIPDGGVGSTDSKNPNEFPEGGGSIFSRPDHREDRTMFKPVYFALDSSTITSEATTELKSVADYLTSNTINELLIEGNCDERGTEGYNVTLGDKRALAIRDHLITLGISGARIHTVSFGEAKPAAQGHDEESWSKNRRGEIVVILPAQ